MYVYRERDIERGRKREKERERERKREKEREDLGNDANKPRGMVV